MVVPLSIAARLNACNVEVAIPVLVDVLPMASRKSKDFFAANAKAVATAPTATVTPAIAFATPAPAFFKVFN